MPKKVSDEELLEELRRLREELGRTPRRSDVEEYSEHSPTTFYRHFGALVEARKAAGLDSPEVGKAEHLAVDLRRRVRENPDAEIDVDDTASGGEVGKWD